MNGLIWLESLYGSVGNRTTDKQFRQLLAAGRLKIVRHCLSGRQIPDRMAWLPRAALPHTS
jgi:hypothetical protein